MKQELKGIALMVAVTYSLACLVMAISSVFIEDNYLVYAYHSIGEIDYEIDYLYNDGKGRTWSNECAVYNSTGDGEINMSTYKEINCGEFLNGFQ